IAIGLFLNGTIARSRSRFVQARLHLEVAAARFAAIDNRWRYGQCLTELARIATERGAYAHAHALRSETAARSQAQYQEQGNTIYTSLQLGLLGRLYLEQGDLEASRRFLEDSLSSGRQVEMDSLEQSLGLARLSFLQGDVVAARRLYQESLRLLFRCHCFKELIAAGLEDLAALEGEQGRSYLAAQLLGAAEALRESIGVPVYPVYLASYERTRDQARA